MSKQIQAYFKTEDDAESARTSLLSFETEHLEVSSLGEKIGRDRRVLLPIAPINMNGNMNAGGTTGAVGVAGAYPGAGIPVVDNKDRSELSEEDRSRVEDDDILTGTADVSPGDNDYRDLEYVLAAKVPDHEYEGIVNKLRESGGYVEIFD